MEQNNLVHACLVGDVTAVLTLLTSATVDVDSTDHGWTALARASYFCHLEIVQLLVSAGANVNAVNGSGESPLSLATTQEHADIVETLLEAGADPNVRHLSGASPLQWAAERNNVQILYLLLEAGADPARGDRFGQTPLHHACEAHHAEAIQLLLAYGGDVLRKDSFDGYEPLALCMSPRGFTSITNKTLHMLQMLISNGATWDSKSDEVLHQREMRHEIPLLRLCILLWAQENAIGRPFTQVDIKKLLSDMDWSRVDEDEYSQMYVEVQRAFENVRCSHGVDAVRLQSLPPGEEN